MSTNKSPSKHRLIFFGNERLATGVKSTVEALNGLIAAGYDIAAIVTNYEVGVSRKSRELEIERVARQHNIPLLMPAKPAEIIDQLRAYNALAGVLVAYGRIIPQSVIDIFPRGIINIHPSLLPLHRGPTPIESVLLEGAPKTGVCIMQLVKEMDAGPVFGYAELTLTGRETKQGLADTLLELGGRTLLELLPGILSGTVVGQPQESTPSYDQLISKADGILDYTKPAIQLEREIRAYLEWPGSRTTLANRDITITKAHVVAGNGPPGEIQASKKELIIYTSKDAIAVDRLKPAGKNDMAIEAFLAGHQQEINKT